MTLSLMITSLSWWEHLLKPAVKDTLLQLRLANKKTLKKNAYKLTPHMKFQVDLGLNIKTKYIEGIEAF